MKKAVLFWKECGVLVKLAIVLHAVIFIGIFATGAVIAYDISGKIIPSILSGLFCNILLYGAITTGTEFLEV